jgi:hypothetical protein
MGEVLGLGISHYPLFSGRDDNMSAILRYTLEDPDIPAEAKDPKNWPALMREEWSDDQGTAAAATHRARMVEALRKTRAALDDFNPDFVVIWGDDQYENFHEDIVPPFCVFAYDDLELKPWAQAKASAMLSGKPNIWNEPADTTILVKGAKEYGKYVARNLLQANFDVSYAYKPLHHAGLPHAFLNSVLYLDYDRKGFPYPVVPFQINCYGEMVISYKGFTSRFADRGRPIDPPSPSPARCFALGGEVARICKESPWRVALIASSSWSHAFLVDKTWRLYPDVGLDKQLYEAMVTGNYGFWSRVTPEEISASGEQETLNWFTLLGAMDALGQKCTWAELIETYVFNSTKVAAVFEPIG